MRRRIMIAAGLTTVIVLALAAAVPVAARMMDAQPGAPAASGASATTISMAQAKTNFTQYLQQRGYDNLTISEVMQFSNQFYAEAADAQTGAGAFELVMSLDGRFVMPEPGPTMMWNTTYSPMFGSQGAGLRQGMHGDGATGGYGMMGGGHGATGSYGMMGAGYGMMGGGANPSATPGSSAYSGSCPGGAGMGYDPQSASPLDQPLTAESAQARVQTWLDQHRPGVTAADATAFPGYFTFHTEQNGKITGMLSIQSSTGAIWEHVWHGTFVAMEPAE